MAWTRKLVAGGAFPPVLVGLIALSWAALFLWEGSPYGRYLEHGDWTDVGLAGAICSVLPEGDVLLPLLLYAGGWLLMTTAMMLPTALPLLAVHRRLIASRPDATLLVALVVAGYLTAWTGFGVAAHLLDSVVATVVKDSAWLTFNGWALGAGVLALAGAFQFSRLKHRCLAHCRTPFSFAVSRWQGTAVRRQSFRLGLAHGIFCVGCCWALMLLMFVVGTGSVGWMLALGAIMALEKNLFGDGWLARYLGVGVGVALLVAAVGITLAHVAS